MKSVSFLMGRGFVGDAAMNFPIFNLCGIRYRPIYQEARDAIFASWSKLITHGARTIYPAHTSPFSAEKLLLSWPQYFLPESTCDRRFGWVQRHRDP